MSALRVLQNSPEWLAARRGTIGSSDIGVIVGESPWKDVRTLAAEKLGLIDEVIDPETRLRMDIGTLMQPALLSIYRRISGREVRAERRWRIHPQYDWASASLDGSAPVRRAVEAKWTNSMRWHADEMPGHVACQVQWQLFVTGWGVADVVVMDRGEPRVIEVERDQAMIDDLLWHALRFREALGRGELPEPDGSESARRLITRLHPADDGTYLEATPEWDELAVALAQAKADAKTAADRQATIENAIRALLADASGVAGEGWKITWKRNADSLRINWPAVAKAYRELLAERGAPDAELDTLVSIHSETAQGARVLRASFKER